MLFFSLFLAFAFIVSYSSILGYSVAATTSTKLSTVGPTAFATATANAVVTGFYPILNISVKCGNSVETGAVFSEMSNSIALLEANNSVSNFYPLQHNLSVYAGNANTLQIYEYEYSGLNASAVTCAKFSTGAVVELPPQITFLVESQKVPVALQNSSRSYVLPATLTQNMSAIIPVKISALLTSSGALYGNLSVTRAQV